jgi:putative membrane protein
MIKTIGAVAALCFLLAAPQAFARSDQSFARAAAQGNLAEIDAGRLASQRARSNDVRDYGRMLMRDHRDANRKLERVADRIDVNLPERPSADQRAAYARLAHMSGRVFDRMFLRQMVMDHRTVISMFREQARERRSETARFAREMLPKLQSHLERARSLLDESGNDRMSGRGDEDNDRHMRSHRSNTSSYDRDRSESYDSNRSDDQSDRNDQDQDQSDRNDNDSDNDNDRSNSNR